MAILFYTKNDPYFEFSNFSPHGFELEGDYWRTVEHYFQAQKFPGTSQAEKIRDARTPGDAKKLGRSRKYELREDWESVKEELMFQGVLRKFQTHPELR